MLLFVIIPLNVVLLYSIVLTLILLFEDTARKYFIKKYFIIFLVIIIILISINIPSIVKYKNVGVEYKEEVI